MSRSSDKTRSHDIIRQWAEKRDGSPATVKASKKNGDSAGILRIDFPGYSGEESLQHIEWDEFFEKFDEEKLLFLYQEKTKEGNTSRFCKFVRRPDGILTTIESQHDEVKALLEKAAETTDRARKTRQQLLEKIKTKLEEHMEAEENTFYPRLMEEAGIEGQILEAEEEHFHARTALERLEEVEPDTTDWQARLKVLKELIEHHVEEEEDSIFEVALDTFDEDESHELNEAFRRIAS